MHKQKPEDRPHASSGGSDDEGHRREVQQAATFVRDLSMVVFMVHGQFVSHFSRAFT
jgi:hypothetical protein